MTEEKLQSIKIASGNVSQDLGFMIGSLGIFFTGLFAISTTNQSIQASNFSIVVLLVVTFVAAVVAIYTGLRWMRQRKLLPTIIDEIIQSGKKTDIPQEPHNS